MKYVPNCYLYVSFSKYCKFNNGRILKQLSIKVINKFIYFSIIENFFSKKKFQQILDIKTIYQDGGEGQADS